MLSLRIQPSTSRLSRLNTAILCLCASCFSKNLEDIIKKCPDIE